MHKHAGLCSECLLLWPDCGLSIKYTGPVCLKASRRAGSLLPGAAMHVRSAHIRQGPQPAGAETCRPQREKRLPRKLADAGEPCDTSEDFGGERLHDHLRCDVLCLLCCVPFLVVPTQDASAGRGAQRSAGRGEQLSAAQALQAEAAPTAGQPQRTSQRVACRAAAVSSGRAADMEINASSAHHPGNLC